MNKAINEHNEKIVEARARIDKSTGCARRDAQKYLKRLLRERKEYYRHK
jgi:hypothetical protein|nr:MAG TPA: hypothetical protein [Caudoviricetes sp.]